ncbi:tetratricopeptide repeat protein [Psychromonas sp.]|uniref:tetratricopeptide repeat protein n=1 Tax=Psychromonas sp. TaxID=1884585 RepID=UPI00356206B4
MYTNSHDISVSNFQEIIIEGSKEKPVLVVFWSQQNAVCHTLLPLLDKLHAENKQAFTLARINCDVEQQIVSHFGVQSIPSVFMFINGQGVDGFAGEQSAEFISAFIKKHTPDQSAALLQQGQTLFAQGKLPEAKEKIIAAAKIEPEDFAIKLGLAQVYLAMGEHENAQPILDNIPPAEQNMIYHSLVSQMQIAQQSAQTPEITALEKQLETASEKQPIEYQLALQYKMANRNKEALALLYNILVSDLNYDDGAPKKTFLEILESIDDPALVSEYRRKLYSLLY